MEPVCISFEFDSFTPNKVKYKELGPSKNHKSGYFYISKKVFESQGLEVAPKSILMIVKEDL